MYIVLFLFHSLFVIMLVNMNPGYLEWVGAGECPATTIERAETRNEGAFKFY